MTNSFTLQYVESFNAMLILFYSEKDWMLLAKGEHLVADVLDKHE